MARITWADVECPLLGCDHKVTLLVSSWHIEDNNAVVSFDFEPMTKHIEKHLKELDQ